MDKPASLPGRRPRLPIQLPLPNIPDTVVPETVLPFSRTPESHVVSVSDEISSSAELEVSGADAVELGEDEATWADAMWETGLQRLTRRAKAFFKRRDAA